MTELELAARIIRAQAELINRLVEHRHSRPASSILVNLKGAIPMPVAISIDDVNGTATFEWADDHGDTDALPALSADGGPITVTLASDNPAVATLAAGPAQPGVPVPIAPVAEGTFNVTLTAVDDQSNPATFIAGPSAGQPITAAPAAASIIAGAASQLEVRASA